MARDNGWSRLLGSRPSRRELLRALAAIPAGAAALGALDSAGARALAATPPASRGYEPGISDTEIRIGNSSSYSGPNAAYAHDSAGAYQAYFAYLNAEQGGIDGRKITFLTYDDGYDPAATVANVQRLVEQDGVFLTAGIFGTPGTAAALSYLTQQGVPLLFPVTGSSSFDAPAEYPWLLMAGPGYARTAEIVGRYWHDVFPGEKIGVLAQADAPGPEFVRGLASGLGASAKAIVAAELAPTTMATFEGPVERLEAAGASLWFLQGSGQQSVQAIRKAHERGWRPRTYVAPTANAAKSVMAAAGSAASDGAITTLSFKDPLDRQWKDDPALAEYRAVMARYGPRTANPDELVTLQAYAHATVLAELLRRMKEPTRRSLVEAGRGLAGFTTGYEVPGVTFNGSRDSNYLLAQLQLATYDGASARWVPFGSAACDC